LAVASLMGEDKKTKDEHVLENMLSNITAKA